MSSTTVRARRKRAGDAKPALRRFTADEFCRMVEVGVLDSHERVELLDGEILLMAAIGSRHMACVNRFNAWFVPPLVGRAIVSVQNAIRLSSGSVPQPDLAVLRPRQDHASALPGPEDVLLVVEVSDTTLRYDRDRELPLYAGAGIPEAWIVNPGSGSVLVGRDPSGETYQRIETVARAGTLSPAAFPELVIRVADLLG